MKKLLAVLLMLLPLMAKAWTQQEITALKDAALAEPSIQPCILSGDDTCVAAWFNSDSTFIVWRTRVMESEILANAGFDFSLVDGLTAGKRDEWSNFLFKDGYCDASKANIRTGIADVWSGTAAKNAVQAAILNVSKRSAKQAEKVLATGTGTTASPGNLTFEGSISAAQVAQILRGS